MRVLIAGYAVYARFRHRQAPETRENITQFVANRLQAGDSTAMEWRFTLVEESDLQLAAKSCTLPVFQLAGLVDPIVPTPLVRRWLKRHCPGFRESKTILTADHNVLGTAPTKAAGVVLGWISSYRRV
jgi:pimeloyl-ACP methyl ester carboxylesterase